MKWGRAGPLRVALSVLLLALVLVAVDTLCYRVTLPVEIDVHAGAGTLLVGSQALPLGPIGVPSALMLAPRDPVVHEYQIDGTDSTNNFTLDTAYLDRLASSPYYRFQSWMRDLDGTSVWRDAQVWADGRLVTSLPAPANGATIPLPATGNLRITLAWQRPETPVTLDLLAAGGAEYSITLDRNDRKVTVTLLGVTVASAYFPLDPAPFAAMVLDFVARTLFGAALAVLAVLAGDMYLALLGAVLARRFTTRRAARERMVATVRPFTAALMRIPARALALVRVSRPPAARAPALGPQGGPQGHDQRERDPGVESRERPVSNGRQLEVRFATSSGTMAALLGWLRMRWRRLTAALHPLALAALGASLVFVAWIARVQYNAAPHIYDASAYFFGAKIVASGRLWAPLPPAADLFPGPFMVQHAGKWFPQYPPGTYVALALGLKLGVPWLVESVMGTLALLGIGLTAARLYDRRVATLAVLLGTLSPFYSYLAASYLSHAIVLCFLAWGFWALARCTQGEFGWNLPLAAALFGAAALTRDLTPLLFAAIVAVGLLAIAWPRLRSAWRRWIVPGLFALGIALAIAAVGLGYNALLTGDPLSTPRYLFAPYDHWGFGLGVGFYGQHTPAAGFVTVDELLTSLAIDLFGWPFYLTLAFLVVPFLTRRAVAADRLLLAGFAITCTAYIGFYYHGIYLGPRYLLETLPFLLPLTARGIVTLAQAGAAAGASVRAWAAGAAGDDKVDDAKSRTRAASVMTGALVAALLACTLLYFLPRQFVLHTDFSGLPAGYKVDLPRVYAPPLHNAVVVTGDYMFYGYILFPLNDPLLRGDVIYAYATNATQYAELRRAFPHRTLYLFSLLPNGTPQYVPLTP
ncbi:MAG TPA: glycosyltransferase family 39 protein [Ktedonobacterales bacterium]|nr:glycosyltransferase family 39 protein [Ktedonobacterales bacterium]